MGSIECPHCSFGSVELKDGREQTCNHCRGTGWVLAFPVHSGQMQGGRIARVGHIMQDAKGFHFRIADRPWQQGLKFDEVAAWRVGRDDDPSPVVCRVVELRAAEGAKP